ncbi:MAG TPA: TetR/AcrR family transcriptional regulator [bacterium]|nr:TetR/AcrR family transcriptional regulator [bacterium]
MSRVVKEYDTRRKEILDAARTLFFSKGYETTAISDIIQSIGIAKGTFYHYFDSKQDLMAALVEEITDEGVSVMEQTLSDPALDALEQFQLVFIRAGNWKVERKEILLEIIRVMQKPENTVLQDRLVKMSINKTAPILAEVIEQGIREELFETRSSEELSRIILQMGSGMSWDLGQTILELHDRMETPDEQVLSQMEDRLRVYEFAIARLLGCGEDSITLFEPGFLAEFIK